MTLPTVQDLETENSMAHSDGKAIATKHVSRATSIKKAEKPRKRANLKQQQLQLLLPYQRIDIIYAHHVHGLSPLQVA